MRSVSSNLLGSRVCDSQNQSYFNIEEWLIVFTIDRIIDVYFVVDIFVNFRSAWANKDGVVVFNARTAAFNYLTGFFLIDVVSTVPWDMLELLPGWKSRDGGNNQSTARITKMLKMARLTKLVKVRFRPQSFRRRRRRWHLMAANVGCCWPSIPSLLEPRDCGSPWAADPQCVHVATACRCFVRRGCSSGGSSSWCCASSLA